MGRLAFGMIETDEVRSLRPKRYVRDVCVRCGRTIERG